MEKITNILEQKRGFSRRKYTLLPDRLLVETADIRKNDKYEIKLDRIGYNIHYQSDSIVLGKIFFYICLAVPVIVWVIHFVQPKQMDLNIAFANTAIWWGLALLNILKKHKDDIFLVGGQVNLAFFRTVPNEEQVLNFIKRIINASKKYLKEKYAIADTDVPEEIFNARLDWLKETEVIDDDELAQLKKEYSTKKLL